MYFHSSSFLGLIQLLQLLRTRKKWQYSLVIPFQKGTCLSLEGGKGFGIVSFFHGFRELYLFQHEQYSKARCTTAAKQRWTTEIKHTVFLFYRLKNLSFKLIFQNIPIEFKPIVLFNWVKYERLHQLYWVIFLVSS